MAISELGMLMELEPFWSWHTPIAWTGYILLVDGVVWMLRGGSFLTTARAEFAFLAAMSVPMWLVFELVNLYIRNWYYINLPEHPLVRNAGYVWSFATIWPAILETGELIAALRGGPPESAGPASPTRDDRRPLTGPGVVSLAAGAAMIASPFVAPVEMRPYLAAPVWLGFIFLLEPINAAAGGQTLLVDGRRPRFDRVVTLGLAGLLCGVLWEFWNYWARTKWIYTVPILPEIRIFEMPILGYGGFPPFAMECFAMYVFARRLLWRGSPRTIPI
jgi:hypothetical protein